MELTKLRETLIALPPVERLLYWITERQLILNRKEKGAPKPWTPDPILQNYRFCNVHREDDTVTKWISDFWREPHSAEKDLWFAMAVARWINWPDTLEQIGFPLPWDPVNVLSTLKERQERGEKVWTGAYLICTQGTKMPKTEYVVDKILTTLWKNAEHLRPRRDDTLSSFADRLVKVKNQGTFMVGQIIADMKYAEESPLFKAGDWWTFAISGPGSRRGMNRMLGKSLDSTWDERLWHVRLINLLEVINPRVQKTPVGRLHAQDLQNCLCEYDKYMRVLNGEGKPRAKYPGV